MAGLQKIFDSRNRFVLFFFLCFWESWGKKLVRLSTVSWCSSNVSWLASRFLVVFVDKTKRVCVYQAGCDKRDLVVISCRCVFCPFFMSREKLGKRREVVRCFAVQLNGGRHVSSSARRERCECVSLGVVPPDIVEDPMLWTKVIRQIKESKELTGEGLWIPLLHMLVLDRVVNPGF